MTAQDKATLKSYFNTGDTPTEAQFTNLIDSIPGDVGVLVDADIPAAVARDAEVSAAILAGAPGGSTVSNQVLIAWAEAGAYELTAITYHDTYTTIIASATVKWPDGSAGTLTVTAQNTTYLKETAYTITHTTSGKTVTQAAVTLNGDGNVTVKPALVIS
jgi:hypothetical protein